MVRNALAIPILITAAVAFTVLAVARIPGPSGMSPPDSSRTPPPDSSAKEPGAGRATPPERSSGAPALFTVSQTVKEGLSVVFRVGHVDPKKQGAATFREGDDVAIGFDLRDATSGLPITGVRPAAWLVADDSAGEADNPRKMARLTKALLEANLFSPAAIDLRAHYVLTLNDDTVSVIDPLHDFSGMKLLALVPLGGKPHDWVHCEGRDRLFVSLAESDEVVVIDTRSWGIVSRIRTPPAPTRIGLAPDGGAVWVACSGGGLAGAPASANCLDTATLELKARVGLGAGPYDMAFSADGRHLVLTCADAGTVTTLQTANPAGAVTFKSGDRPVSVSYSALARQAWVAHAGDGRIVAVDPERQRPEFSILAEPGLEHLRFAPDGRWALAVNAKRGEVLVFDAANGQLVRRGRVDGEPDRVVFSDQFAYLRRRTSPVLRMVPLEGLGLEGREISQIDVPMGSAPLGDAEPRSPLDTIVPASASNTIMVVNSGDRSIHYYREGMSAPMGTFRVRNGRPKAAMSIDRSLRERHQPGCYETTAKLAAAADFKVVFYLESPQIVHSFRLRVEPDPVLFQARNAGKVDVAFSAPPRPVHEGEPVSLRFRVTDRIDGLPRSDLTDLRVQAVRAPGPRDEWYTADPRPDGWYEFLFRADKKGVYDLFFECASIGLQSHETQRHTLHVDGPDASVTKRP